MFKQKSARSKFPKLFATRKSNDGIVVSQIFINCNSKNLTFYFTQVNTILMNKMVLFVIKERKKKNVSFHSSGEQDPYPNMPFTHSTKTH